MGNPSKASSDTVNTTARVPLPDPMAVLLPGRRARWLAKTACPSRPGLFRDDLSHPGDNFGTMNKESKEEQTKEFQAFAEAERTLLAVGIGFTVVEGPTRQPAEPPLAA